MLNLLLNSDWMVQNIRNPIRNHNKRNEFSLLGVLIKVIENEEENKFSPLRSPNRESTHSYKLSPISKGILKESNKRISKSPKRQSSKSNISILTEKEPIIIKVYF